MMFQNLSRVSFKLTVIRSAAFGARCEGKVKGEEEEG